MANDITNLINMFRRLSRETYNDQYEARSSDEHEPQGQQIGEGDVNLTYLSLREGQPDHIQVSQKTIDGHKFQQEVKDNGGILLDMFNSNTIYMCEKKEMDEKVSQHMIRTGAYSLIQELNETNSNYVQQHLNKIVEQVTLLLNDLHTRQCLTDIQVQQMSIERSLVQMDYLYYLPDAHQVSMLLFSVVCREYLFLYVSRKILHFNLLWSAA